MFVDGWEVTTIGLRHRKMLHAMPPDLREADLREADLREANLCDCNFHSATITYRDIAVVVRFERGQI